MYEYRMRDEQRKALLMIALRADVGASRGCGMRALRARYLDNWYPVTQYPVTQYPVPSTQYPSFLSVKNFTLLVFWVW